MQLGVGHGVSPVAGCRVAEWDGLRWVRSTRRGRSAGAFAPCTRRRSLDIGHRDAPACTLLCQGRWWCDLRPLTQDFSQNITDVHPIRRHWTVRGFPSSRLAVERWCSTVPNQVVKDSERPWCGRSGVRARIHPSGCQRVGQEAIGRAGVRRRAAHGAADVVSGRPGVRPHEFPGSAGPLLLRDHRNAARRKGEQPGKHLSDIGV